ncbi:MULTISPECIES: DUF2924 domain-containing protein [Hyphobacterium]|uniref:DUF2924 domain-containing protein n=1 Tax=Hyphobacterium vulgare TaxID=1736751 RepID=A0ABV6ZVR5_9PROT
MARRKPPDIDLEALLNRSRSDLADRWAEEFGMRPPYGMSQPLLARLLAYDLQVRASGGLGARLENRLVAAARGDTPKPTAPRLKPGSQLVRDWNGITHRVDVTETGFVYRDTRYKTLSSVAKAITGTHWSGPRFFGLTARKAAP